MHQTTCVFTQNHSYWNRFPLFPFCFFLLDKANSCLGCVDFLISPMIASTSACCCRRKMSSRRLKVWIQGKPCWIRCEPDQKQGAVSASKLDERSDYWHSNRDMWEALLENVKKENASTALSSVFTPSPKTYKRISTSNGIAPRPTYTSVKITVKISESTQFVYSNSFCIMQCPLLKSSKLQKLVSYKWSSYPSKHVFPFPWLKNKSAVDFIAFLREAKYLRALLFIIRPIGVVNHYISYSFTKLFICTDTADRLTPCVWGL